MRIVLLGAPGSGKRTQTKLMVEKYGIPPIYTGELLKAALTESTAQGRQVRAAMEAGQSVTEEVVLELIQQRLQQSDARNGFILDGFPRNILQAITLDELLAELGQPIDLALLIEIETDALMERLVGRRTCLTCGTQYNIYNNPMTVDGVCDLCGGRLRHRADDNEETISNRLHVYDHLAAALIKHYSKQGKMRRVDGAGEVDEIFSRICELVESYEAPPAVAQVQKEVSPESLVPAAQADAAASSLEMSGGGVAGGSSVEQKKPAKKKLVKKKTVKKKAAKKGQTKKVGVAKKAKSTGKKKVAKKQAVNKSTVKKKVVKKPLTKKKASKKKVTVKKTSPTRKKVAAKKKVSTKKAVSKKQPVKKPAVKKAAVKKRPAKKRVVKKAVKKQSARKVQSRSVGKKVANRKKPVVKKGPTGKKRATKKVARKKA